MSDKVKPKHRFEVLFNTGEENLRIFYINQGSDDSFYTFSHQNYVSGIDSTERPHFSRHSNGNTHYACRYIDDFKNLPKRCPLNELRGYEDIGSGKIPVSLREKSNCIMKIFQVT